MTSTNLLSETSIPLGRVARCDRHTCVPEWNVAVKSILVRGTEQRKIVPIVPHPSKGKRKTENLLLLFWPQNTRQNYLAQGNPLGEPLLMLNS